MKSIIFNQHQVNHALNNEEGMFRVVAKNATYDTPVHSYKDWNKDGLYYPITTTIDENNKEEETQYDFKAIRSKFKVGETIFVKENFWQFGGYDGGYDCDNSRFIGGSKITFSEEEASKPQTLNKAWKRRAAQHMKQEHSRLILRIKSVKVERLQDISEEDCYKSGVECLGGSQIADTGDYFESEYYFGELEERIRECGCDATIEHCDKCVYDFRSPYANTYDNPFEPFIEFWNSTHKKSEEKFEANPFVFCFSYEVVR